MARSTTIYLERTIDASHVIPDHPGKCSRLHGHTYRFEVWLTGPVGDDGMVLDFFVVKELIDAWDHRHLNDVVDYVPTAENLANDIQERLTERLVAKTGTDRCGVMVRLWETATSWAQAGDMALASSMPRPQLAARTYVD